EFGFRYVTRENWGRLRRLFTSAIGVKLAGGVLAAVVLFALAPAAHVIFHKAGLTTPLRVAALLPLVQCTENVGGVALNLRGRYDIRGAFLCLSMTLRLTAIAVAAPHGLTATVAAIVAAPAVSPAAGDTAGWLAFRRFPQRSASPLGEDRRPIFSFVGQSSVATAVTSSTVPLSTLVLARVASTVQVAWFRAALAPQQAFAVLSSPARMILLTEQTRDWERGSRSAVFAGIRRYTMAAAVAAPAAPPPMLAVP